VSIKGWMSAFRQDGAGTEQAFDGLASSLAGETISRRRALQLAGATVLASAGLGVAASEAEAQPRCPETGTGCRRCCEAGRRKRCICLRTEAGRRRCVWQCCPEGNFIDPCESNAGCPGDMICIRREQVENCCENIENQNFTSDGVCMFRCDEPRPDSDDCDFFGRC
jgi:hypothetical protein